MKGRKRRAVNDLTREQLEEMGVEYSVLEMLLLTIRDGYDGRPKSRRLKPYPKRVTRLRQMLKAMTDRDVKRVDEPDSKLSRALIVMARIQEARFLSTLTTKEGGTGGEIRDILKDRALAREACKEMKLRVDNNVEILRKRFVGSYGSNNASDQLNVHLSRTRKFNERKEKAVYADFLRIQKILAKYGIPMWLDDVFWRVVGNDTKRNTQ